MNLEKKKNTAGIFQIVALQTAAAIACGRCARLRLTLPLSIQSRFPRGRIDVWLSSDVVISAETTCKCQCIDKKGKVYQGLSEHTRVFVLRDRVRPPLCTHAW